MLKAIAALALLFVVVPAQAADVTPVVNYEQMDSSTWTGFYAGIWGGGRLGTITATTCGGGGIIGLNCATDIPLNGLTAASRQVTTISWTTTWYLAAL